METSQNGTVISCLRCGNCCSRYQALVDKTEMERIVDFLGITLPEFISSYTDHRWPVPGKQLLSHHGKGCVFLLQQDREWLCSIHPVKPQACRDWTPSLQHQECRQGMASPNPVHPAR